MGKFIDLTGKSFGQWTVISKAEKRGTSFLWNCLCACGNESKINVSALTSGSSTRCLRCANDSKRKYDVGFSVKGNQVYGAWTKMLVRCYNEKYYLFHRYGGRGITVCDDWVNDFKAFYNWSMQNGFKKGLSIDRIDNNKGYSPDNCRWATMKEQQNNRSNNHLITYNGETKTLAQWSEKTGLAYHILKNRINRYRWSIERAFTEPVNQRPVKPSE